jgi:hypothetical protein
MTQQLDELQDQSLLLAALAAMGHEPAIHPRPVSIRGYGQEILATRCEIVLSRERTGLRADIGFHREDGVRISLVSDSYANKEMPKFIADLRRSYYEEKAVRTARHQGMRVVSRRWVDQGDRRWLQLKVARGPRRPLELVL